VTAPAIVVRGATLALCRRTNYRKAFLAPWHHDVRAIWLYSLALAQARTHVAIHQSTLVINHHHTEVTPSEPNLPDFTRWLHGESSKAINALLHRERFEPPRQLWDDRSTAAMRLLGPEAQAAHLVYGHVNPVAAGLVRSPSEMPSAFFDFGLWKTGPLSIPRPDVYFDPDSCPDVLPLSFTPPPELYRTFDGDLDALVHHMRRLSDEAVRTLRDARQGRPVLGAAALRRIHPWNEPRSLRAPRGGTAPVYKVGAGGLTGKAWSEAANFDVLRFRKEHRDARQRRLEVPETVFPHGTYLMRVEHGAQVAEAYGDAVVSAPGMTLEEVRAQLEQDLWRRGHDVREGGARGTEHGGPEHNGAGREGDEHEGTHGGDAKPAKPRSRSVREAVREVFRKEAEELVAQEGIEFVSRDDTTAPGASDAANPGDAAGTQRGTHCCAAAGARSGPRLRHRSLTDNSEAAQAGEHGASRLVVTRDCRRGRPNKRTARRRAPPR
jgi:hypothetical protein